MCSICVMFEAEMLTRSEAIAAGRELIRSNLSAEEKAHVFDLVGELFNKENNNDKESDGECDYKTEEHRLASTRQTHTD